MNSFRATAIFTAALLVAGTALADPWPYEILKFQQLPLDGLDLNGDGAPDAYWGHDEISTAWAHGFVDSSTAFQYQGYSMADDFADKPVPGLDRQPVVHVRWWGSYPRWDPSQPVDKFLIVFESDVPRQKNPPIPSHPGQVLASQIVTRVPGGPPPPGTFTEEVISPGGTPLYENLFEYNAELHPECWFPEDPDTVYWLKIVALVDVPPGTEPVTAWGWHNRDWTVQDTLASVSPTVILGEHVHALLTNPVTGDLMQYWHFQDDAVSSPVSIAVFPPEWCNVQVVQEGFIPQHDLDDVDGPPGIGGFSKDLAFELYTIPEPAMLALVVAGGLTALLRRRRQE